MLEPGDHKHKKIRFRRTEIVRLHELPSAAVQDRLVRDPHLRAHVIPALRWAVLGLIALVVILPAGLYALSASGIGDARLRGAAETALTALVGVEIDADIGARRLSIDRSRFVGVEMNDVRLTDAGDGIDIVEAGTIRFGLRFMPLLGGEVQLGSAGIEDATVRLAALPRPDGTSWTADMVGPDGLIDPSLVMKVVFRGLHRAFEAFDMGSTKSIDLTNVEILLPAELRANSLTVSEARIERTGAGTVSFKVAASVDGNALRLEGSADLDDVTRKIAAFRTVVSVEPTFFDDPFSTGGQGRNFAVTRFGGGAELTIEGDETSRPGGRFHVSVRLNDAEVNFANGQNMTGSGRIDASFDAAARKIEIETAQLAVGRSRFDFNGAIGPAPLAPGENPSYRFELVSDGSLLAPGGSHEPDLMVLARLGGRYDPAATQLTADEIGVRTGRGEVLGKAVVTFAAGKTPGIDFVLAVPQMPASHAKQLWPWLAAPGAQRWAHANLFGGLIRNSSLSMTLPPGRLGDGVALQPDEIWGHFEMEGARFDITGQIPPVRDAIGVVDFRGASVDISLTSGTVYLPTGRTVAASNGKFLIPDGDRPPVIGELDIAIEGSADAVAELASYKPIDAMRHLALSPDELSGHVTGRVKARIPLQRDIDIADLGWNVKLDYDGLSIAKPFQGQTVSDAVGTIEVTPDLALVKAQAQLNGMPAVIDLAEPLGQSEAERVRNISLELNDKAREALAPGLGALLSGPVSVKLEGGGENAQRITADLGAARLDLPWVGWSKGAGIPATMTFLLDQSDGETRLSDIKLSGKTFAISGAATVAKGGLTQARFDSVKLNRDDSVAVDIKRAGAGYTIAIRGESFDARALIKRLLADPEAAAGESTKSTPVSLSAKIGSVVGFDGETLSLVEIDYEGIGASVGTLRVTGATRQGGAVSVSDRPAGGGRTVRMTSSDAGGLLRFLDVYPHMQGGQIALDLTSSGKGPLKGQIDARDFALVNEPRLRSIVATAPAGDRSLNDKLKGDLDTSRVTFERGFALVEKGEGYLSIDRGVLRGPLIGTTFQGSLYDRQGNMAITGTFMPAYGLNRLFAEIPLVGLILGNGRDRGLIGITYKVAGNAKSPQVQVNPISAIAPGIFRSIFEFN